VKTLSSTHSSRYINKRKEKQNERMHVPAEHRTWLASIAGQHYSTRPRTLTLLVEVNFTKYSFSRDKIPIDMKMLVFFLGKCVQTTTKTMDVARKKKTEGTSSASFGVGTAAKSCELNRCANRVCSRTDNKEEVLEII